MKKILYGIAGLVILVLIILGITLFNIGPVMKHAINSYGPKITKTEMHLAEAEVSLSSWQAELSEFLLGNPEGFSTPHAITVQSMQLDIDGNTLLKDPLVIDQVAIAAPEINYEIKGKTDNFRAILDNIKESTGGGKAPPDKKYPEPEKKKKPGKNILIRDLVIKNGTVSLAVAGLKDRTATVKLPDLHLTNIGGKDKGASPEEIARQILENIYQNIRSRQVEKALRQKLKDLGVGLDELGREAAGQLEKLREKTDRDLDSLKNTVEGLFSK
ncbi:MAG TPA: hypothetical protein VKO20_06840 [Desulfosalsimonadaceae bacterium]|nr:hypothetical protein [Desulfosalsimonadaceae bacterium]